MMGWIRSLFSRPAREVACVSYAEGDRLLKLGEGWRLAPEEDRNHTFGVVWLERPVPQRPTEPTT